ncbi:MAG: RNA polymerase factor sigma-54 [Planctomycetota bacterium]
MRLGLQQQARTDLQLRLSPQMLQRIEVLQLQSQDLVRLIEQELQENDALELAPGDEASSADSGEAAGEEDYSEERDDEWEPSSGSDRASPMDVMTATAKAEISLQDHLNRQLELFDLAPRERQIAQALVESLNDRGWLSVPLDEVEVDCQPPATADEREHCLHVVQRLEPTGVGARDLTECLLLQLPADEPDYDLAVSLVVQHLDDIAHNRIPRIARETGAGVERVLAAIERISHLDPIPGRRFGGAAAPVVRPDVVVRRVGDDYEISIENDWVPDLRISRLSRQLVNDRRVDPELRKHVRGRIEGAKSLIDAIEQRKNTLFRVASELVNRQADYLEHGPAALRPLRMQEVADALAVHVSTVSRAISGKSIQTPRGIIAMKAFFTGEVPARDSGGGADSEPGAQRSPAGKATSSAALPPEEVASRAGVQDLVRALIARENAREPLSDEAIVSILKEQHGLEIARRTVTKYRKTLKIGSSRARRVFTPE